MDKLVRGVNALGVMHKFYNKDFTVWVEGDEDIVFWDMIFKANNYSNVNIKKANGKELLQTYINMVTDENAKIIVACDSDYMLVEDKMKNHDRIVFTYGYSIENSMYCPKIISNMIMKLSRKQIDISKDISEWYDEVLLNFKDLLIYDCANEKYSKSIKVMGGSADRYINKKTCQIDNDSISNNINNIKGLFSDEEFENTKRHIESLNKEIRFLLRGHFLTDIVRAKIKIESEKRRDAGISISNDTIYIETVDGCKNCNPKCTDKKLLESQIKKAVNSLAS